MLLVTVLSVLRAVVAHPLFSAAETPAFNGDDEPMDAETFSYKLIISIGLVLAGGVFAG